MRLVLYNYLTGTYKIVIHAEFLSMVVNGNLRFGTIMDMFAITVTGDMVWPDGRGQALTSYKNYEYVDSY